MEEFGSGIRKITEEETGKESRKKLGSNYEENGKGFVEGNGSELCVKSEHS